MPRRNRNRHHHQDSSSSSDTHDDGVGGRRDRNRNHDDDDDDIDIEIDLRDIPGQIEEEVDYINDNLKRSPNADADLFYKDEYKGTRVGNWSGRNKGERVEMGAISLKGENGIHECGLGIGELKVGVVDDDDQKGVEAGVEVLNANHRLGPVKVNASALGAGYDAGIGRNTGAFVRGNLASVGGSVGPVGANLGIGFDTGGRVGADGVEARVMGTGLMVDRNQGIEVSFLGTSIKFKPW